MKVELKRFLQTGLKVLLVNHKDLQGNEHTYELTPYNIETIEGKIRKPIVKPISDLLKSDYADIFVQEDIDNIIDCYRVDKSLDVIENYLVEKLINLGFDIISIH